MTDPSVRSFIPDIFVLVCAAAGPAQDPAAKLKEEKLFECFLLFFLHNTWEPGCNDREHAKQDQH